MQEKQRETVGSSTLENHSMGRQSKLQSAIAELPPAYFSMVMATGSVSLSSHLLGFWFIAMPLLWLNVVLYVSLWMLTLARMLLYPQRFFADLSDHIHGVGFFTMVAGTCILGSQFIIMVQAYKVAIALLIIGTTLWTVVIYSVFTAFIIRTIKPPLETGISGLWLVSVVATQSVSILSGLAALYFTRQHEVILFFSLSMFLLAGMLYLLIIMLIFYRFMFFPIMPEALRPPYWINMGAVAISTLSGALLTLNDSEFQLLKELIPFIKGFTLLFWATATWWIPLLLLLGVWRHLVRRVKFTYDPQYWSLVFPLGVYTACTVFVARATGLEFLLEIPRYFVFAAQLAWSLTFIGWLKSSVRLLLSATDASTK